MKLAEIDLLVAGVSAVAAIVTIPLAFQYVNYVSQRLHASHRQDQVNDNTSLNNTAISGVAGQEEVSKTAKE